MPIPVALQQPVSNGPGIPGDAAQPRIATLGAVTFGAVDEYGTLVYLNDITGWTGSATTTGTVVQRAADSGGWAAPAYEAPRVIGLSLTLMGGSFDLVERSIEAITAAVPTSDLDTFAVVSPDGTIRQAEVRQGGDVLSTQKGATAQMSIALVAPDPRRYDGGYEENITGLPVASGGLFVGATGLALPLRVGAQVISGTLQARNSGNMSTRPVLTVSGPCPPFAITHVESGRQIRFNESVPAGRSLVIDTDRRRALLDGVAPRTVTGTWFEYGPATATNPIGINTLAFSATGYESGALLVSHHKSAWR